MYVQDIKSPGVNITAELTEREVDNFKESCKMFATTRHDQLIDEYLLKLSQMQSTSSALIMNNNNHVSSAYDFSESSLQSLQNFKNEIAKIERTCDEGKPTVDRCNNVIANANARVEFKPTSVTNKLESVIKIDEVLTLTRTQMDEIQSRSTTRVDSEQEIIDKFSFLLTTFDPKITVKPFGSVKFGFGGQKTNFNILITEGKLNFSLKKKSKLVVLVSHILNTNIALILRRHITDLSGITKIN